jgi:hypothetical protein
MGEGTDSVDAVAYTAELRCTIARSCPPVHELIGQRESSRRVEDGPLAGVAAEAWDRDGVRLGEVTDSGLLSLRRIRLPWGKPSGLGYPSW